MGKGGDRFDHYLGFPGTFYAKNTTPDKETGLGTRTEDTFVQRFKAYADPTSAQQKVAPDVVNTVMPWVMYSGMKEEDLRAIYKYLRTLEPDNNKI